MGHRFYWPEIGRFIQQDPIGSGINWYAYARNNPVFFIDPEGETWYKPWTWFKKDPEEKAEPSCAQGQPPAGVAQVGGLVAMGAGAVAVAGVEVAKRAGRYGGALAAWGPYIQGAGLALLLLR